jgi:hypothetical protein
MTMRLAYSIPTMVLAAVVCGGCGTETPPANAQNPAPAIETSQSNAAQNAPAKAKPAVPPGGLRPKTRENPYGHD